MSELTSVQAKVDASSYIENAFARMQTVLDTEGIRYTIHDKGDGIDIYKNFAERLTAVGFVLGQMEGEATFADGKIDTFCLEEKGGDFPTAVFISGHDATSVVLEGFDSKTNRCAKVIPMNDGVKQEKKEWIMGVLDHYQGTTI
ncbi:MAG: hypothetical protein GY804_03080 [Alphaproteobacteria bacterium]|nr:hypothetical protein [Alphaproteobacteria bacterium]